MRSPLLPRDHAPAGRRLAAMLLPMTLALMVVTPSPAKAEYADVVLNRNATEQGVPPVIFPHWFHRIRFRCKVCHAELGFEMRVGANPITMNALQNGKYCGACHNDEIAWGLENCVLCHSGKMDLKTKIQGGHQTSGPGRW